MVFVSFACAVEAGDRDSHSGQTTGKRNHPPFGLGQTWTFCNKLSCLLVEGKHEGNPPQKKSQKVSKLSLALNLEDPCSIIQEPQMRATPHIRRLHGATPRNTSEPVAWPKQASIWLRPLQKVKIFAAVIDSLSTQGKIDHMRKRMEASPKTVDLPLKWSNPKETTV